MSIPDDIMDAALVGDIQTVERFLDEGGDVNAANAHGATLLLKSVSHSQVELCRVLIARGADPNKRTHQLFPNLLWVAVCIPDGGVSQPHQGGAAAWSASPSGKIYQILLESGADVNVLTDLNINMPPTSNSNLKRSLLAIMLIYFGRRAQDDDPSVVLEIVTTLLRAGARLDSIVEDQESGNTYSASWCLDEALAEGRHELAQDEYFIKAVELIVGIQKDGSFKRFVRRPHRAILRLRSLFSRGRATLKKWSPRGHDRRAIEFLVKLGDNGVVWNILSFWRAST